MIRRINTSFLTLLFAALLFLPVVVAGQLPSSTPRQEKLLNGLKVQMWNSPGDPKVSVRLRIHSGAAFDPQGKEGVMQLLADSFFPTADARSFFSEELGGSLEVATNYDYIQINVEARSSELVALLETLAQAVINPTIDKETVNGLKKLLAERVDTAEKSASYVADRAVAKRLFGTFPYGRPNLGDSASIQEIDFADLVFAKGRLLTADNATLSIAGGLDTALAFRAVRRYFGTWQKSDRRIPATFRQPDPPPTETAVIDLSFANQSEFRAASRGVARNDTDFFAADMLRRILNDRIKARYGPDSFVRFEPHILPGSFVIGISGTHPAPAESAAGHSGRFGEMISGPISEAEFVRARKETLDALRANAIDLWLDLDTFRLAAAKTEYERAQGVKIADLQRLMEKLKSQPAAYVHVRKKEGGETADSEIVQE